MGALDRIFKRRAQSGVLTLVQQVAAALRKYGTDAHVYMPGPGVPILGPEIVDFSTLSAGAGITITPATRSISFNGSQPDWGGLVTTIQLNPAKNYLLSYTISRTSGMVKTTVGPEGYDNASGNYTKTQAGTGYFNVQSYSAPEKFVGTVSNISVKEILGYTNYLNGFQAGNYLESTGNTNASVDGAVGLVLDAAGSVGAEFVNPPGSWSLIGDGGANIVVNTGSATVTFNGSESAFSGFSCTENVVVGKTYKATFTITARTAGQIQFQCGGYSSSFVSALGTYQHIFTATGTLGATIKTDPSLFAGSVGSISIREVTGTHATQATTANKPILRRGIVNLLLWSNDRRNPAYFGGEVTVNSATSISLGTAGYHVQGIIGPKAGDVFTSAFVLSGVSGTTCRISVQDNSGGYAGTSLEVALTEQPQIFAVTRTLGNDGALAGVLANGSPVVVNVHSAGLFRGALTAQQILAAGGIPLTTTAPASSSAGAYAWQFDGSNDSLALPGPLFQMTDDHWVVAAVGRCSNAALWPCIVAPTAPVTLGIAGWLYVDAENYVGGKWSNDAGDAVYASAGYGVLDPRKPFVASLVKHGSSAYARCNGVSGTPVSIPTGACTVTSGAIGGLVGAPLNGTVMCIMCGKGAITPADLRALEKWAGSIAGVPIA